MHLPVFSLLSDVWVSVRFLLAKVNPLAPTTLHLVDGYVLVSPPVVSHTVNVILIHHVITMKAEPALPTSHIPNALLIRVTIPGFMSTVVILLAGIGTSCGSAAMHLFAVWSLEYFSYVPQILHFHCGTERPEPIAARKAHAPH